MTTIRILGARYLAALVVSLFFMSSAVAFSADHITHTAHRIGLSGLAATFAYLYVDGTVLLGKLCGGRLGAWLFGAGAAASLAANMAAGRNWGERGFGAFVVVMWLVSEHVVRHLAADARARLATHRAEQSARAADAEKSARRSEAAKRAAATRAARATAPVSPGAPVRGPVLTDAELAAAVG